MKGYWAGEFNFHIPVTNSGNTMIGQGELAKLRSRLGGKSHSGG